MSRQLKDKALRLFKAAKSEFDRGLFEDSLKNYLFSLDIQEKLSKSDPFLNILIAATLYNLGVLLSKMGKPEEAKNSYERAIKMYGGLLAGDPGNVEYQLQIAGALNNLGILLSDMGKPEEAKNSYERALKIYEALLAGDPGNVVYQSDVAGLLNNLGVLLSKMGKPEETKNSYERALKMREGLLAGDPGNVEYQSDVASVLNNLGNLLSDMGKPEEAKNSYERALKMREGLLASDPGNVVYQSDVASVLNNLGLSLEQTGYFLAAKKCYEDSLVILKESLDYMTIKVKSRAIINLIQLIAKKAGRETNNIKKSSNFKEIYEKYLLFQSFFDKNKLDYEKQMIKEAGLTAHIHYLMLSARNEDDPDQRIREYEICIQEVKKIFQDEKDENLKELWSSMIYYLEGRILINKSIKSEVPDKELIRLAVEKFERAKERYKNAQVCYYIYSIILEIESAKVLDDNNIPNLKEKLKTAIGSLPAKMNPNVVSAFKEIDSILDLKKPKYDPESFRKINRCITKIDGALGDIFYHIIEKLETYSKEPFNPNVSYSNWELNFRFDEPEKIQGKLTIKIGDNILFDEPLGKRYEIPPIENYVPVTKDATVVFETQNGKIVTRQINFCDKIKCGEGRLDVHTILYDCKRKISSPNFNIAIVQLKYHLFQENHALMIEDDEKYRNKVTVIMDEILKNKTDLIIFPEFSIPFEYLSTLKKYSDDYGPTIIAGSHYVTENNLMQHNELFADKFDDKDLLKNISPIIISGSLILHTEKVLGAKIERACFSEEGMKHGTLNRIFKLRDDVTCGIMICYDYMNTPLRSRISEVCNLIVVPQTNPGTKRFHEIGKGEIINPSGAGMKAYVMASGLFTFPKIYGIMGGDSGVIPTLDSDTYNEKQDSIILSEKDIDDQPVKEQFIQLASLKMNFNTARDTQVSPVPITYKLIHIFEKNEIVGSKKEKPELFLELIENIKSCTDKEILKELLGNNKSLIQTFSPLWHKEIWGTKEKPKNLINLDLDKMKDKCLSIIIG
ncbi:MAG: kinesin light chain [Candidatus Methanoperedens nitroreducens]|uniref:Kinesin light chain n=1 Tax=Candidatus Methanoperedens nitratireducens TaxID=1392998 RepID=A0A0N8KRD8_9EURY|nr:MAG: kinesin light chain [Candidatus Methanoperedens sp. BLZ1]